MDQATPAARIGPSDTQIPKPPNKKPKSNRPQTTLNDVTADFAIVCEGGTLKAHKSVLVAACPYFERMIRFGGKEASSKELVIKDVGYHIMKYSLDFMYAGRYTLPNGEIVPSTGYCDHWHAGLEKASPNFARIFKRKCPCAGSTLSSSHLLPHIEIYAFADYLDMDNLKTFAQQGAKSVLHVHWNDSQLELPAALDIAFTTTPDKDRGVKKLLIETMIAHPSLWVDDGDVRFWLEENPTVLDKVETGDNPVPYVFKSGRRPGNLI